MEIKITGKLPLQSGHGDTKPLADFVERTFPDLMNVSDDVLYISGRIEEEAMSLVLYPFLAKVYPLLDLSEPSRLKVKGDDPNVYGEYVLDTAGIRLFYSQGMLGQLDEGILLYDSSEH